MLKVIKEEYVGEVETWSTIAYIYKNPTGGELNDLYKDTEILKILGYEDDCVFVANARNTLHSKMADALKPIMHLNLMDYVQLYYDAERNSLYAGYSYDNNNQAEDYFERLLLILPKLFKLRIVNKKTKVSGFGELTWDGNNYALAIDLINSKVSAGVE